jgi:hypothetical protein
MNSLLETITGHQKVKAFEKKTKSFLGHNGHLKDGGQEINMTMHLMRKYEFNLACLVICFNTRQTTANSVKNDILNSD